MKKEQKKLEMLQQASVEVLSEPQPEYASYRSDKKSSQENQWTSSSSSSYTGNDENIMMMDAPPTKKPAGLGLNLAMLTKQKESAPEDFQDEFMGNVENFSESWRDALKREKRF
jgi:hypothetical protein